MLWGRCSPPRDIPEAVLAEPAFPFHCLPASPYVASYVLLSTCAKKVSKDLFLSSTIAMPTGCISDISDIS